MIVDRWYLMLMLMLMRLASMLLVACLFVAARALASPDFPAAMQDNLGLTCQPECLLCHTREVGGFGTTNTPFGIGARRAGLECCDEDGVGPVLDKLRDSMRDSDEDGVSDIDELVAGTDANAPNKMLACAEPSSDGGCAVGGSSGSGMNALGLVTLALCLARGRRSRRCGIVSRHECPSS